MSCLPNATVAAIMHHVLHASWIGQLWPIDINDTLSLSSTFKLGLVNTIHQGLPLVQISKKVTEHECGRKMLVQIPKPMYSQENLLWQRGQRRCDALVCPIFQHHRTWFPPQVLDAFASNILTRTQEQRCPTENKRYVISTRA